MPKKYIHKQRGNYTKHNYENMELAVQCVKSGTLPVRAAAKKYGIAKTTLWDRISGKTDMYAKGGRNPVLTEEIENKIVSTVTKSAEKGFGLSRRQLLTKIGTLCKKTKLTGFKNETPSKHVWYSLKQRHPELTLRKPEKLGTVRVRMLNPTIVGGYFDGLEKIIADLNIADKPHLIWNAEETGKNLEHIPTHVIARKGAKNIVSRTSNSRSNVTIMACANAIGVRMPPLIIARGKTSKCLYGYNTAATPEGTVWSYQEKAWMTEAMGEIWFRDVFLKHCGTERPQLLLLDGHSSHETLGLLELAEQENISILAFPQHTTHFLQPLDRAVFGPFNKQYNKACTEFLSAAPCNMVNKWTFPSLFNMAWELGVTKENIASGFRACGIYPLNRHAVPVSAFLPSQPFDKPIHTPTATNTSDISTSVTDGQIETTVEIEPVHTALASSTLTTATELNDTSENIILEKSIVDDSNCTSDAEVVAAVSSILNGSSNTSVDSNADIVESSVSSGFLLEDIPGISDAEMFPVLDTNISATNSPVPEDPKVLPDLINREVDILAVADEKGVAEVPSSVLWNSEIENIFSPPQITETAKKPQKPRAITSHRLLTSSSILELKREALTKKEENQRKAEERKSKRVQKGKFEKLRD